MWLTTVWWGVVVVRDFDGEYDGFVRNMDDRRDRLLGGRLVNVDTSWVDAGFLSEDELDAVRRELVRLSSAIDAYTAYNGNPVEVLERILSGADLAVLNSGARFEHADFHLNAYDWSWYDGHDGEPMPPQFLHKRSGVAVSWYKYYGRGTGVSKAFASAYEAYGGISFFTEVVDDCIRSLIGTCL